MKKASLKKLKRNPPKLKSVKRLNIEGKYRYFDLKTQSEIPTSEYQRRKKIQLGVYKSKIKPKKNKKDRVVSQKFETVEGRDYLHDINEDLNYYTREELYNVTKDFVNSKIPALRRLKNIPEYTFFIGFNGGLLFGINFTPTNYRVGEFDLSELLTSDFDFVIGEDVRAKINEIWKRLAVPSEGIKFDTIFLKSIQLSIRKER